MHFEEISFAQECPTLSWSVHTSNGQTKTQGIEILRVKFFGKYRTGPNGKTDSELISLVTDTSVKFWMPKYAIIDLSGLEFQGGQDFENIYDCVENDDIQTVVLVGAGCRMAMNELYFGPGSYKDIVDDNFFFDDIDKAVEKLTQQK